MKDVSKITNWLQEKIAEESGESVKNIDCEQRFDHMDLDSLLITSVAFDLSEFIGEDVDPTAFSEFPTINELSEWLVNKK